MEPEDDVLRVVFEVLPLIEEVVPVVTRYVKEAYVVVGFCVVVP